MARNRPRKQILPKTSTRKPVRTTPGNPNFGVGKLFCPKVPGKFYVLGQTITKSEERYSEVLGPFNRVTINEHFICGDSVTIASWDGTKHRWICDNYTHGYYELTIYTGGEEVPQE